VTVLQKKVCMLGGVGVGKTSLVRRYVESVFSERYQATVGVKIDRKLVVLPQASVNLMLWDLQGETEQQRVRSEYLRGSAGIILVADASRPETLVIAEGLSDRAREAVAAARILVLSKIDLIDSDRFDDAPLAPFVARGWRVVRTSARTGEGVDDAFRLLVEQMVAPDVPLLEER